MKMYIYSCNVEIEDLQSADLVAVIDGVDNADCEEHAAELYDSNEYYWSYSEV